MNPKILLTLYGGGHMDFINWQIREMVNRDYQPALLGLTIEQFFELKMICFKSADF